MRRYFPVAVFFSVALASLVMAGFAYFATLEAGRFKFEATADDALNRIQSRVELNLASLNALHAFFVAEGGAVSRGEFDAFYRQIAADDDVSGLRGLGFLLSVKPGEEARASADIVRNYGTDGSIWPDSSGDIRAPVVLFEPLDEASTAGLGLDMFSDPERRPALTEAMAMGKPRATGRLLLGKSTGATPIPGLIIFRYLDARTVEPALSVAAGSEPTELRSGFVFATFRAADLFNAALGRMPLLPVNAEVYDGAVEPGNLLFASQTPPDASFGNDLLVTRTMEVAGRTWTILFRPSAAFTSPSSKAAPLMLGIFGLLLALAIAAIARYRERAYDAVAQLQETAERNLFEKDLMLQEMKHRIKNSITRVLAIARQTAANATDVADFSASFGSRLQAMAASQDMLTRSRWQKADLGELLRIELAQVFGKELPSDMLSGPKILLDETTTQALGLTFHELATNAMKYGAISGLKVSWQRRDVGGKRWLSIDWKETGLKGLRSPEKTGFGTKLIDMNVTRELGGKIERQFRDEGLTVAITIPHR